MTATERPVVDFDHHSAEHAQRHDEINDDLLARCPVAWSEQHDGYWVVSKHADVMTVARDDATFSSAHDATGDGNGYGGITIPTPPFCTTPIEVDPPDFFDFRKLLNPYFSPNAAKRWEPYIAGVTDWCLDKITDKGAGDFVLDLANPLPAIFTLAFMGLPTDDWESFAAPAHDFVAVPTHDPAYGDAVAGVLQLVTMLWEAVQDRRTEPRTDLITHLMGATIAGEPMSDQTINEILFLLVFGGVDTTTGLTANALVWLADHPDERERLRADRSLMPKAIEEFLRFFTPVQGMARTVTTETELAGQPMQRLDRLLMNFAAANRDPDLFDEPGTVRLDRAPNRHAAFGLGIHRCLGSNFARVLIGSMLGRVLDRVPDYEIDLTAAERYTTIGTVNGWARVPARFTATASLDTSLPAPPPFVPVVRP